jgi:arylsulfatase A-like enzyme
MYYNSTFQRNQDAPVSHEGEYTTDVPAQKTQGFLDSALAKDDPFFLVVAPNAPHSNVDADLAKVNFTDIPRNWTLRMTSPIPAERHAHLFKDVVVPRTENFNPDSQIVPSWFRDQPKLTQENIDYNDEFYRNRLRALQAVDELVDGVFNRLDDAGVLDDTYVVYTTDNGFHISQHRLQPGKECGFEEDINIPLIIRGPNVAKGAVSHAVTAHADLAPTFLSLIGAPQRADFDGVVIPLTIKEQEKAKTDRHEHVTVEYWGFVASEGKFPYHDKNGETFFLGNNTYKSIRIVGQEYDLYYSVWCHGEHELYDLQTDPGQLRNLLDDKVKPKTLIGYSLESVVARLDSLLLVGKTCKGIVCSQPWKSLHPQGDVKTLGDALREEFDEFYEQRQPRVSFGWCVGGHVLEAEGAQFERDGLAYWRPDWSVWV